MAEIDRETGRQTGRDRERYWQTERLTETEIETGRDRERLAPRETYRDRERLAETDREAGIHIHRDWQR